MKALFPLKTCISMYFIPNVLSFCIASVFIFITLSCSGLVTLSTQLWREKRRELSLLSRLLYKYNAHSALSLNRLRKLCWHPSSARFGYTLLFNTTVFLVWAILFSAVDAQGRKRRFREIMDSDWTSNYDGHLPQVRSWGHIVNLLSWCTIC